MKTVIFSLFALTTALNFPTYTKASEPNEKASEKNRLENLAEELVSLRSELEQLNDQIENQEQLYQSKLQTLNIQKADLSAALQRDQLKITELKGQLNQLKQNMDQNFAGSSALIKEIDKVTIELKNYIKASLPFKTNERLKAIDALSSALESQKKSPYRIANELWALIEDEIRLHRDLGIYKQVVEIDNKEQICDIAKIGMLTYYYKTPAGTYGMIKRNHTQQKWETQALTERTQINEVERLFDSFKKQIKVGPFRLPGINKPS